MYNHGEKKTRWDDGYSEGGGIRRDIRGYAGAVLNGWAVEEYGLSKWPSLSHCLPN